MISGDFTGWVHLPADVVAGIDIDELISGAAAMQKT